MAITAIPNQQPKASEETAAPGPTFDKAKISDTDSAAEQLVSAGLFAKEFADDKVSDEAPAPDESRSGETRTDDAPEETPASDQVDTDQIEPEETPAIEAPVSWTAEEKASFKALPPDVQQAVIRRESERERGISQRLQEAADRTKQLDAQLQQVANERAQQSQSLRGILLQLNPDIQRFASIDWNRLANENPAEWARQRQAFEEVQSRANYASAQLQVLDNQQRTEQATRYQQFLNDERVKLVAKVPEFAEPEKAKAFAKDLSQFLTGLGFTDQEIDNISDHRMVMVARAAMLADKSAQALKAAQAKKVAPSNVRQLRPGVKAPGGATEEGSNAKARALRDNLRKTGSTQDAANLLMGLGIVS